MGFTSTPIYDKARLVKIGFEAHKGRKIDPNFEKATDLRLRNARNYAAADAARVAPK